MSPVYVNFVLEFVQHVAIVCVGDTSGEVAASIFMVELDFGVSRFP
jgi:hypothetical protein